MVHEGDHQQQRAQEDEGCHAATFAEAAQVDEEQFQQGDGEEAEGDHPHDAHPLPHAVPHEQERTHAPQDRIAHAARIGERGGIALGQDHDVIELLTGEHHQEDGDEPQVCVPTRRWSFDQRAREHCQAHHGDHHEHEGDDMHHDEALRFGNVEVMPERGPTVLVVTADVPKTRDRE